MANSRGGKKKTRKKNKQRFLSKRDKKKTHDKKKGVQQGGALAMRTFRQRRLNAGKRAANTIADLLSQGLVSGQGPLKSLVPFKEYKRYKMPLIISHVTPV